MSHDAPILGMTCMGGSLLGPGEGSVVAFYPSGKLKQCYLAGDQVVQGVPCMSGGFFGDGRGGGTMFNENGKLKSCKLTKDFGAQHKGDRFVQGP
jgi:antitoxin component YwqK of YwqJK toxin-antitoxin module